MKYNFVNDVSEEVFSHRTIEDEDDDGYAKTPWWMDTYDGKIYLMLQSLEDGTLGTYIQILDSNGNLLEEKTIDILQDYGTLNCNSFFVVDGYFFFFYYYASDIGADSRAIMKETNGSFERIYYSGQAPVFQTCRGLIRDRYIIFDAGANNGDYKNAVYTYRLVVFDTNDGSYWYVKLPDEALIYEAAFLSISNGAVYMDREGTYGEGIAVFSGNDILGVNSTTT